MSNLIQNSFNNLIINKKRKLGILEAEKKGYKTLVLDDGLQDYDIFKDLSIVCFNLNQKSVMDLLSRQDPSRGTLRT